MRFTGFLRDGFRAAGRHKRLVLVLWLAPLLPAVVLGVMAASNLAPALGQSLFADRVLEGDWYVVLQEFRSSPADALSAILVPGIVVMALLSWVLQVVLSAGVVEVLLGRERNHPFVLGIRRNLVPFTRAAVVLAVVTAALAVAGVVSVRAFFKLAEAQADGRLDLVGVAFTVLLIGALWAPADLAADLSRIAAARHGDRSMVRGFLRAWWWVVRRPRTFVPLYLIFLALPLALHTVYYQVRAPWTPATMGAIAALVIAQQFVMLTRAAMKLGFWGAEVAAYRGLDEPRFCRLTVRERVSQRPLEVSTPPDSAALATRVAEEEESLPKPVEGLEQQVDGVLAQGGQQEHDR